MYRVLDGRGTGKTGRLMLLAKENNAIIACSSPKAMEAKAQAYGIVGLDFISYWDFYQKNFPEDKKVFIDELEAYVSAISDGHFMGYSLSIDD